MELKILSRCPTCHNQTLFLSDHGALVCSWIECKEPCVDRAIEALQARLAACEAECTKWQRIRTPTHGPCCTCQKCGQFYDECRCDLDEVADELEQTKARVRALEARLEIDHHYDQDGRRVEVPPDQRDREHDGIECRDETIKLQDECIHTLEQQLKLEQFKNMDECSRSTSLEQENARLRQENEALRQRPARFPL